MTISYFKRLTPLYTCCAVLTLALAASTVASAQVTGKLSGIVEDASGKALPQARVALTLPDTTIEDSSTITSHDGTFFFPVLRPTFYDLTVEAANFKKKIIKSIKIDPAVQMSLPPIQLEVGALEQSTEVTASAQNLQTSSGEVASTATHDQVASLPLYGRDPLQLLLTLPGVTENGRSDRTIDGQSVSFANISYDGVNVQESFIRASSLQSTTLGLHTDQMNEATIVTVNPGAIYSGGSSQVAFSTKSGTNSFHGTAYWLNIPGGIGAQGWAENNSNTPSTNRLNQLGIAIGGPLKKDKAFYFLNFETDRDRSTVTRLASVPTSPLTTQDSTLAPVLALIPSNPTGVYRGVQNNGATDYLGLAHMDYLASPKHAFGLTLSIKNATVDNPGVSSAFGRQPTTSEDDKSYFYAGSWRWSAGRVTNEIRAGGNLPSTDFLNSLRSRFPFIVNFQQLIDQPMLGLDPQGRNDYLYNYQDNLTYVRGRHSLQAGFSLQQYRLSTYGINRGLLVSLTDPRYLVSNLALGTVSAVIQDYNVTSPTSGYVRSAPVSRSSANLISGYAQDNWRVRPGFTLNLGVRYDYLSPVKENTGAAILPTLSGSDAAGAVYDPNLGFGFVSGKGLYNPDKNNFAPYLGFAWAAGKHVPVVIRAAYSISYVNDDLLRNMSVFALQNPFQSLDTSVVPSNATLQNAPSAPGAPAFPSTLNLNSLSALRGVPTIYSVDPNLRTPFVQQANFGIETQAKGFQFGIRYAGNRLEKGLRSADRNQVMLPSDYLSTFQQVQSDILAGRSTSGFAKLPGVGLCANFSTTNCQTDFNVNYLLRSGQAAELARYYQAVGYNRGSPYNFFGNPAATNGLLLLSNLGRSRYDALQLSVTRRVKAGLSLTANYVYSKTTSNLDDYQQGAVDPYLDLKNPKQEWAPSPFNLTHAFKSTLIYDLPFAHHFASRSFGSKVLGGWTVSSILIAQSGAPFSVLAGYEAIGYYNNAGNLVAYYGESNHLGTFNTQRDSGQNTVTTQGSVSQYFGIKKNGDGSVTYINNAPNTAFSNPAPGAVGNLQRRSFSGPGAFNLNLGLRKTFAFSEQTRLQFRGEAINLLNNVNWLVGDQTYLGGTGGANASFAPGSVSQWTPPRTLQFSMRLMF